MSNFFRNVAIFATTHKIITAVVVGVLFLFVFALVFFLRRSKKGQVAVEERHGAIRIDQILDPVFQLVAQFYTELDEAASVAKPACEKFGRLKKWFLVLSSFLGAAALMLPNWVSDFSIRSLKIAMVMKVFLVALGSLGAVFKIAQEHHRTRWEQLRKAAEQIISHTFNWWAEGLPAQELLEKVKNLLPPSIQWATLQVSEYVSDNLAGILKEGRQIGGIFDLQGDFIPSTQDAYLQARVGWMISYFDFKIPQLIRLVNGGVKKGWIKTALTPILPAVGLGGFLGAFANLLEEDGLAEARHQLALMQKTRQLLLILQAQAKNGTMTLSQLVSAGEAAISQHDSQYFLQATKPAGDSVATPAPPAEAKKE